MVVYDAFNHRISISKPKKVVSLVPSITETLFSFGLEKYVIGVTEFCIYPERAKQQPREVCGGTKNPDINLIIKLKPDLVIANKEENQEKHIVKLKDAGINIWVTYITTIKGAVELLENIIEVFDLIKNKNLTKMIFKLKNDIIEIKNASMSSNIYGNSVFCPIWRNPWMSVNRNTYIHDVLTILGLKNVIADIETSRYPEVKLSDIMAIYKPELILLPTEPYHFSPDDVKDLVNEYNLMNQKHPKMIIIIDGTYVSWYGSRITWSLKTLYNQISSVP